MCVCHLFRSLMVSRWLFSALAKKKKWTESTDREMHSYLVFHLKFHNCQFLSAFVRWANDILSFSLDFCIADVAVRVALHATRMLATVCMWYALYLFPWRTQFFFLVSFGNFMFFQSRPFFFFLCSLHWLLLLYFIFFFHSASIPSPRPQFFPARLPSSLNNQYMYWE